MNLCRLIVGAATRSVIIESMLKGCTLAHIITRSAIIDQSVHHGFLMLYCTRIVFYMPASCFLNRTDVFLVGFSLTPTRFLDEKWDKLKLDLNWI